MSLSNKSGVCDTARLQNSKSENLHDRAAIARSRDEWARPRIHVILWIYVVGASCRKSLEDTPERGKTAVPSSRFRIAVV